ncbi:MAG: tetratricopeptide repeat protein [Flavobacteriaceae bacterium]|nr:tetratricopeptide repeat protein [Flavobacteriaceae bacterium]
MKYYYTLIFSLVGIFISGQGNEKISLYKGNQSFKNQDFDEASTHYLNAIEKENKNFDAHYNLANSLYKKEMYRDAVAQYNKALQNTPNDDEKIKTLYNIGNAHFQNKDKNSAIKAYQEALKLDPKNEKILTNLRIAKKLNQQNSDDQNNKNQEFNKNQEKKSQPEKKRNEYEENLLKRIEAKEKHTAKRALQNRDYYTPQGNQKDW